MQAKHYSLVLVILVCQAMLVVLLHAIPPYEHHLSETAITALAFVFPFAAYIASVFDAPIFERCNEAFRGAILTFSSFFLTCIGFAVFICGALVLDRWH